MGILNKTRIYLIGSIEAAKDSGYGWRDEVTEEFSKMGIRALNPCVKPFRKDIELDETDDFQAEMKTFREEGNWDLLAKRMKEIRIYDLKLVDIADAVFVYLDADIMTFGKVIGGGLPVGAFAARKEIMDFLSPNGPVYQAGTLSGNPLAMAAGYSTLSILNDQPEIYQSLEKKTAYLHEGLEGVLSKTEIPFTINRLGSMISLHFTGSKVVDFDSSSKGDNDLFKKYFHGMLKRGVYLPPSAFESYFLNDALSYQDIDFTIDAFKSVVSDDLNV
jgi:hypothetical protein